MSILAAWGCGQKQAQPPTAAQSDELPVIKAEVLTVAPQPWPTIVRVSGSLFADERAAIGAKVAGRVATVNVELGDAVAAGAPLVALDRQEFELQATQATAELEQARAAVGLAPNDPVEQLNPENAPPVREAKAVWDEAKTKSKRWAELRQKNAVTEADAEAVIAAEQVAAAQYAAALNSVREKIAAISVRTAELSLARQRLADAVVPAPFDGLVVERHVAPGSYVQIGSMIATIVRTDPIHFRGMMPERHARRLAVGQPVSLQVEAEENSRESRVTRISPTLDPLSRALLFEAELPNPDRALRAGLFAEGEVTLNAEATAIALPDSAVIEFAGVEKVWKVVDGAAKEQPVVTGGRRAGRVEIVEGVSSGDILLLHANQGRMARVEPLEAPPVNPSLTHQPDASATSTVSVEAPPAGGAQ
ncbi:MAG: efflux RND transporter periplasmic adaptor subunit [Planctomycetaceae bacterium]